jgi:hypothetical protein
MGGTDPSKGNGEVSQSKGCIIIALLDELVRCFTALGLVE